MKKNKALSQLANQLARKANMERWCFCLLSTLQQTLQLTNITFLIEHEGESQVMASWFDDQFHFYPEPLPQHDFNDVPLVYFNQVKHDGKSARIIDSRCYTAIWDKPERGLSRLILPIHTHYRQVGFLYAETMTPEPFDVQQKMVESLLILIASDLSARLLQQEVLTHHLTRRSVEAELEVRNHSITQYLSLLQNLHRVTLTLSKASNLEQLYRDAVQLGREYLAIDRMAIFLTDFEKNEMRGTFGTDPQGNLVSRTEFSSAIPDHPLVNEALSRKDHVVVKENAPLYFGKDQVGVGWNAMIAMWNGDNCIGWVAADNLINQRILTEHQKEILKLFGAALGQQIVIRRNHEMLKQLNLELEARVNERTKALVQANEALEEANQQLAQWSMQDGLTGIANRRFFDMALKRYWEQAVAQGSPLHMLMLDVDHFKRYNDQYGHLEGDNCLKKIASALEVIVKPYPNAVLSRFGGEEFTCLIPSQSVDVVKAISHRMLKAVRNLMISHGQSEFGVVTVSIGCCSQQPTADMEVMCLLDGADKALYRAKKQGRNQLYQYNGVLQHDERVENCVG
ncbi:diguanylate cyclase domain-containing protein [Photobacterium aphoticum]|nr:sensor domain-containing diguanylate cyclase [Photobacterium aphoticum]GHA32253.1 diguanylate cyclase [Photobacterium aphoticum]